MLYRQALKVGSLDSFILKNQQTDQQINKAASTQIHLLLFFWISSLLTVHFSGLSTVTLIKAF